MAGLYINIRLLDEGFPSGLTVHNTASLQASDFVTKPYVSRNSIIVYKGYVKKKNVNAAEVFYILNSDKCKCSKGPRLIDSMTLWSTSVHFGICF